MQRFTVRLIVALLAFGIGIGATAVWIAYRTPEVQRLEHTFAKESVTLVAPNNAQGPCGYASSEVTSDDSTLIPPPPPPTGPISGGVLNSKAISKPTPSYPAIAKAARVSGTVTVQVVIDEAGRVISARAVSGHPLLQQAAVQGAYQARFTPTCLFGRPVKVAGVLTYNFVLQ